PFKTPDEETIDKIANNKKPSILDRIFQRVKSGLSLFQQKSNVKLEGRIYDLQQNTDEVLAKLDKVKEILKSQVDDDLFSFVASVIDPMTKDVRRIQKLMEQKDSIANQAKAFKKYNEWIEKARLWVQIGSKRSDRDAI